MPIAQIIASAINGAFLLSLGVDLILEREGGMSFGLRLILDGSNVVRTACIRTNESGMADLLLNAARTRLDSTTSRPYGPK